ncbi:helix-turn-helix domain-containing protein [Myroides odoratimimus]|uniref:XRE family transcriptional regulator n=1 Tax=Myroides odoratimimus TaxID=76832 RepID=UPI0025761ABE|nr:S24 family peptidase [Myroides odoratimimus]MDM1396095.1 helix-turn-helix domain-containing protein [Myroides odoratimimus]
MNEVNQRISQIADYYNIKSYADFAQRTGLNHQTVSNYLKGKQKPDIDKLSQIKQSFEEIDANWLLTGNGNMIKSNDGLIKDNSKGVPYYEGIEATGSILTSFNDIKENPSFYISYPHFDDCTAYLPMAGDSMYPKYCSGEIIAVKQIYNFDIIQWGEAYMIVTDSEANDLRTIKLLFPHKEEDKIILRASNPSFAGDTIIPKKNIVSLFLVKGKITRNQL